MKILQIIPNTVVDGPHLRTSIYISGCKHNYACLATPAEGLSGKFTKIDKKEFGIIPGVTDKEYYTNSNHVPVEYKCSIEHKFKIEGPYHELTTAGHIGYCEIDGDLTKNPVILCKISNL